MNSGIYKITNIVNEKFYVGSSKNVRYRWAKHKALLRHNCHPNSHLQVSWNKYGESNFRFDLLEECPIAMLLCREQFFIDKLKPQYNQTAIAGKVEMTQNMRQKIAEATTKAYSEGRLKPTTKEVYQYDLRGNYLRSFSSVKEASLSTGAPMSNISLALNGHANIAGGFVWRFYKVLKLNVWFNRMGRPLTREPYKPKRNYKKRMKNV